MHMQDLVWNLFPIGGPWSFISRMRILAGGQVQSDIGSYGKVHDVTQIYIASASREHYYGEGLFHFIGVKGKQSNH